MLVKPGDRVERDAPLITLETDKATMDVPATAAGVVQEVKVRQGRPGLEGLADRAPAPATGGDTVKIPSLSETVVLAKPAGAPPAPAAQAAPAADEPAADISTQLLVIGAGPGGYTAAFRAADLGLSVTLVDRWPQLGGVCLNVGCIPSKALLHAARVIEEAESMSAHGIKFQAPEIDAAALKQWKNRIVGKLTAGLTILAKQRKVSVIRGTVALRVGAPRRDRGREAAARQVIGFEQCIIAAGSEPARIPGLPDDPRVVDSTGALDLAGIPKRFLVIGGGIIGLEMACVYDALGSEVSVVELTDALMPGCDRDLVRPLEKRLRARYAAVLTGNEGRRRRGEAATASRSRSRARARRRPRSTTACCARSGACRTAARSAPEPPASPSTTAASSRSTGRCARTCRTFSRSATSSASRCSPTRRRTRARSQPRSPRARRARSMRA